MKQFAIILLFLLVVSQDLLGQETLDLTRNKECELFPEKGEFNMDERLQEIKRLGGQLVTVYLVKGKDNRIKTKYTGKIDLVLIDQVKLPLETLTKVLVVTVYERDQKVA